MFAYISAGLNIYSRILKVLFVLVLASLLVLTASFIGKAFANPTTPEGPVVLCRNQSVVRTIRVEKASEKAEDGADLYVTIYARGGVDREIGRGRMKSSMDGILENVRGNLESAGWRCSEVNQVAITSSSEL